MESNAFDNAQQNTYTGNTTAQPDLMIEMMRTISGLTNTVSQLQSYIANLEKRTYQDISLPPSIVSEGAMDEMASRIQQKIEVGIDQDGNSVYRWATGSNMKEYTESVCRLIANFQQEARAESEPPQVSNVSNRRLFEEYANHWYTVFAEPHLELTVRPVYKSQIQKHIIPAFTGRYVDEITTQDIQKYMNDRANMAKSTVRDQWNKIKQIFASALEDGLITKNPATSTRLFNPATKKEVRNVISEENVADIIKNIRKLKNRNARLFMALLMFTDMRPCEIRGLRWEDFDFDSGLIYINRGVVFVSNQPHEKGTKSEAGVRMHPIDPELIPFLEPIEKEGFVVQCAGKKNKGKALTEQAQRWMWKKIKETIDTHGIIPYEGRHTYITAMHAEGVDPKLMQDTAGHANFNTTSKNYIHTQPKQIQKVGAIMQKRYERMALS